MRLSNSILRQSRVLPSKLYAQRTFSTSPQWLQRTLPVFEESSSPELHNLLQLAREKIIPIAALNMDQKKYLFSPRNKTTLESDPLYIEFANDEAVQLGYTNPLTDLPGKFRLFNEATDLATTKEDWQNVSRLLKGIAQGERLQAKLQERYIRLGIQAGHPSIVLGTVEAVEGSKVSLKVGENLLYLLEGLRKYGFWSAEDPEEASAWLVGAYTRVITMMEHRKHCGAKNIAKDDLRRQPWVLAPLVEILGLRLKAGWDSAEKSAFGLYAARLVDMLDVEAIENASSLPDIDLSIPKNRAVAKRLLLRWEPVYSALELIQEFQPQGVQLESVPLSRLIESLSTNLDRTLARSKEVASRTVERDPPASWLSPEVVRWTRYTTLGRNISDAEMPTTAARDSVLGFSE